MRNTWINTVLCLTLVLSFCMQDVATLESKIRFRLYKKALQEVIEKNWGLMSEYAQFQVGDMDLSSIFIKDTQMSLFPEDVESGIEVKLEFVEGQGAQLEFNDFKIEASGSIEGKPTIVSADLETFIVKFVTVHDDSNSDSQKYNIPKVQIDDFKVEVDEESIKISVDGADQTTDELRAKVAEVIKLQTGAIKILLDLKISQANIQLVKFLTSSIDTDQIGGDIKLSDITFHDEYIEIGINAGYAADGEEVAEYRNTEELSESAKDTTKSVELVIDENILNTGLYSWFHENKGFSLREAVRVDDPTNEYGSMFDQVLMSQVLGQGWKEMVEEFGQEKKVDAECSFGKELFEGLIDDIKPSKIRFLSGSRLDINLSFGCSVKIENDEGVYVNFRSFFFELYAKFKLQMRANDAAKRITVDGDVDELKAVKLKIFKQQESMVAEETALLMMANMGLGMLKSQISQALQIPQLGYPTIKECTGLTLLRPTVDIYDGFLVVSTDLGVKPAEKGCDLMEAPTFDDESDPSDLMGSPDIAFGDSQQENAGIKVDAKVDPNDDL
jgi:hypothetical protein